LDKGSEFGKTLRVVHDPVEKNDAHAQVRRFTDEDLELLGHLADNVFSEIDFVEDLELPSI
jgi:hypothetical protein